MVGSMPVPSSQVMEREIQRFGAFADAYNNFLTQFGNKRIFTEEPPDKSSGSVAANLLEGRYLLHAFYYGVEKKICGEAVSGLLAIMGRHLPVREKDFARLTEAFTSGGLDAHEFVETIFHREGDLFLKMAGEQDLEEDLTTFFAVYLLRLFRAHACRHLCEDISFFDFKDWQKGYCPACGHWPAMALVEPRSGNRTLWCLTCGTLWPFGLRECVYCHNQDEHQLGLIGSAEGSTLRAVVCHGCREYLKEVQSPIPVERFPFDAHFLGTHPLDLFARSQGFVHESLLAFETDNTRRETQLLLHRMRLPWDH